MKIRLDPHPAPARLIALVDLARSQPELFADCEPSRDPRILAPGHVVTGSLRRGFMASMVFNPAAWA